MYVIDNFGKNSMDLIEYFLEKRVDITQRDDVSMTAALSLWNSVERHDLLQLKLIIESSLFEKENVRSSLNNQDFPFIRI